MTYKKALVWSGFWIMSALLFAGGIGYYHGIDNASIFLTGYIVEKMLSLDNLFMFYLIFRFMGLTQDQQRNALNYGITGSFVLRGLFILSGCFLVNQFNWLLYLFAAFLIYSGIKLLFSEDNENEPSEFVEMIRKRFPTFGIMAVTIIVIELVDIMFALDSIPAILSITQDSFLVLSSNIFAVLGLRSLYFVLLGLIKKFIYLQYCVSTILIFIGVKMLIKPWHEIATIDSLILIISVILVGITASQLRALNND